MSRYFYYPYLLGLLINTIFFVPRLLLNERFNGSIMAILLGIAFGTVCSILFVKAMGKFPGEGIPEMFKQAFPNLVRIPLLAGLGVMWALAGSIILVAFSSISLRFLSPETSPTVMLLCYCSICCYAASFRPLTILNMSEIVILLNAPMVIFIMYKSLMSKEFSWDSVMVLSDYALKYPSLTAFAVATYPFTGYINMALYNRIYKEMKVKHLWIIPLAGMLVMSISFLIPVALLGVDSVDDYLYTWISTADTMRLEYGPVDRVVFVFLFVYIGFSLMFIAICWNIGALLIRDAIGIKFVRVRKIRAPLHVLVNIAFAAATFAGGLHETDKSLIAFVTNWVNVRLWVEILLVAIVLWLAQRKIKHA